eukprot:CAMPEP_0168717810 /NCGR_PEP_ID=MMETSP0724-20121128/190_1 /TAXON_ID=265536 /ORGANISM="Amphiprora sp., Strain CCMP467" /LENGTH=236 /DNA_ID=CAMNT_0008764295 /DNA_START=16 /DNA_END=726 /DNA_ORIENTATION=+
MTPRATAATTLPWNSLITFEIDLVHLIESVSKSGLFTDTKVLQVIKNHMHNAERTETKLLIPILHAERGGQKLLIPSQVVSFRAVGRWRSSGSDVVTAVKQSGENFHRDLLEFSKTEPGCCQWTILIEKCAGSRGSLWLGIGGTESEPYDRCLMDGHLRICRGDNDNNLEHLENGTMWGRGDKITFDLSLQHLTASVNGGVPFVVERNPPIGKVFPCVAFRDAGRVRVMDIQPLSS